MSHNWKTLWIVVLAFSFPGEAAAAEQETDQVMETDRAIETDQVMETEEEIVRKKTRLDFSDTNIDGTLVGPDGSYIPGSGRVRFNNLIELRRDFLHELETSGKEL